MRTKLQLCDSADLCHQCNGNFGQILLEIKLIRQKAVQIGISRRPEVFLGKGVLKICSKFTGEHPCRSAISIKLLKQGISNFIFDTKAIQQGVTNNYLMSWCFCNKLLLLSITRSNFATSSTIVKLFLSKMLCFRCLKNEVRSVE